MQEVTEQQKEIQKIMEETRKQIDKLGKDRFSEVMDYMIFPAVVARFKELGYSFHIEFEGNFKVKDKNRNLITEIDAYLENETTIVVIEIKTKPNEEDVNDHIQRIEKLKQNRQEFNEPPKKIIGAIVGVFSEQVKAAAIKAGFYVLIPSGDTIKFDITPNFKPKEF
jgi:hypothetical protein